MPRTGSKGPDQQGSNKQGGEKVVIIGISAAGKSTSGRILSELLENRWVDVDELISQETGRGAPEIIRVEGEKVFRELEERSFFKALASDARIVSLGGGAVVIEKVREQLSRMESVVCLAVSPDTAVERLIQDELAGKAARPMMRENDNASREDLVSRAESLFQSRRQLYRESSKLWIWTDFISATKVAKQIVKESRIGRSGSLSVVPVEYDSKLSEVVIGEGILAGLGKRIQEAFPRATKAAVIFDSEVQRLLGERILQAISSSGKTIVSLEVKSGESSKRLSELEVLAERLAQEKIGRSDVVIAVGGGVVGDLGGFLASVYARGMGLVQVPTTVVAQVDSAIGGKTGVNLQGGKNLVGTIYQASIVFSDVDLLKTLPEREFRSGLAEVVKYGVIGSRRFFEWLAGNADQVLARDPKTLVEMVEFCALEKVRTVKDDVEDRSGKRAVLNFGHTVGHALETLTGYKSLLHGEAVSLGMIEALKLGEGLGLTSAGVLSEVLKLLQRFRLPVTLDEGIQKVLALKAKDQGLERLLEHAISADKKREGGSVNFVFVSEIGRAFVREVALTEVARRVSTSLGNQ